MNQHDSRSDPASQDRSPDAPHPARRPSLQSAAQPALQPDPPSSGADAAGEAALPAILARLREHTGHDFRHYKRPSILRRIARRMQARGVRDLDAYLGLIDQERAEAQRLFEELLIGVTSFFRDRDDFSALEQALVPRLFLGKRPGDELRAWVAACSTGEEAYSLAMLLHEHAARLAAPPRLQVFATDIDPRAIQAARSGAYPATALADVPAALLQRWFTAGDERYTLHPMLRESLLFAEHNLLSDPPFSRLDLVSCRNFLIYLEREHHRKVLETFHFALAPGGYLFLGSAESAEAAPDLFAPVDARHKLYRALPAAHGTRPRQAAEPAVEASTGSPAGPAAAAGADPACAAARALPAHPPAGAQTGGPPPSYGEIHREAALQALAPSVLVDRDAQILYIAGDAARFLRHAGGEPTRDLVALSLPELRLELRAALFQARQGRRMAATARVRHEAFGAPRALSVTVRPLDAAAHGQDGLMLVEFHDMDVVHLVPAAGAGAGEQDATLLRQLDQELRATRRKLQETMDHADAAQAESHMTHEWLQSTLAQLHAALEEQHAGQEELQSVNEELMTLNAQLRAKVEETAKAHDDLSNLVASTDIATIFLDREMRIKRTTPRVRELFNVLPADVGRPLTHLAGRLRYPGLAADVQGVLHSLAPLEREVPGAAGRFYIVRIHPYRTLEDRIDGVVMTFFDITLRRAAELALRRSEDQHRAELERQVAARTFELEQSRDLLRATMDSSMDMIQVFEAVRDADGAIVDFRWALNNHTSESRYGEVRGQSLLERNPGVIGEGIFDAFCAVTETGIAQQAERHYVHEQFDGWFLQSLVKLGDGVATTTKEISEWKRAQAELLRLRDEVAQARLLESQRALRASERHLELAMSAAGMHAWEIDVATGRLSFGANANANAGIKLDDGSPDLLTRIEALMPPEDRAAKRQAWERAMRGEAELHHTGRFVDPASGATIWMEAHGAPVVGPAGTPERVVGVAFNVSERKRAEEALRVSGERLALLLESMGDGVIGVAGDGRCTFVNAAGAALLGYRSGEMAGQALQALLDSRDQRVAAALAAGASARIEDALWRRGDGAVAALSCLVSPMALDGQAGAVIVFRAGARAQA
jgi:PAS domain S-box-containing protein